jgi:hypothetical protein
VIVGVKGDGGEALLGTRGGEAGCGGHVEEDRERIVAVKLVDKTILVGDEATAAAIADEGHGTSSGAVRGTDIGKVNDGLDVGRDRADGDGAGNGVADLGQGWGGGED